MLTVGLDRGLCCDLGEGNQALHILGICVGMIDGAERLIGGWLAPAWQLWCLHLLLYSLLLMFAVHVFENIVVCLDLFTKSFVQLNEVVALIDSTLGVLHTRHVSSKLTCLVANVISRLVLLLEHYLMLICPLSEGTSIVRCSRRCLPLHVHLWGHEFAESGPLLSIRWRRRNV